jgi:hypothetical protein
MQNFQVLNLNYAHTDMQQDMHYSLVLENCIKPQTGLRIFQGGAMDPKRVRIYGFIKIQDFSLVPYLKV